MEEQHQSQEQLKLDGAQEFCGVSGDTSDDSPCGGGGGGPYGPTLGTPYFNQFTTCGSVDEMLRRARILMQLDMELQLSSTSSNSTSSAAATSTSTSTTATAPCSTSCSQRVPVPVPVPMQINVTPPPPEDCGTFLGGLPRHVASSNGSSMSLGVDDGDDMDEFRRTLEFIVGCFEFDVITKSEVFRDLIETFLYPAFDGLQMTPLIPRRKSSHSSASHSSSAPLLPQAFLPPGGTLPPANLNLSQNCDCVNNGNIAQCCESGQSQNRNQSADNLACASCLGFLLDPVTITCGHSYCKKCLQKESPGQSCYLCGHVFTSEDISCRKTNVLLGSLVEKWWPKELLAATLRNEGNALFENNRVEQALEKYNRVLDLTPTDHLTLANRSRAFLSLGRSDEALLDAESAIRHCPRWLKGYFRKCSALISLRRYEDALVTLITCIYLMKVTPTTPSWSSKTTKRAQVMNEVVKVVQRMFSQVTSSMPGSASFAQNSSVASQIFKRRCVGGAGGDRDPLQFWPYPTGRRSNSIRRFSTSSCAAPNKRRMEFSDYDAEYNSSGDEVEADCDISGNDCNSSDSGTFWSARSRYAIRGASYIRQQCANQRANSFSCSGGSDNFTFQMDLLSQRMKLLLRNTNQELKIFEQYLRRQSGNGNVPTTGNIHVDPSLISSSDLDCSLCYRLLFQPVSTSCGHTFCRSCLERCLDHNPCCPLCKHSLENYLANREHGITEFLEVIVKQHLPLEYQERLNQHLEELNSGSVDVDVPIFVCTMAYPTIPCPLHVFEPRYRLMIRRCMENGSNSFGMCCYLTEGENNYGDFGTLLEIKNIQYFADGRSVVHTMGCRRFKVIRKSVVDGYNAARIEILKDQPVAPEEIQDTKEMHDKVLQESKEWLDSVGEERRQRIFSHFGQMPPPEEDWITSQDGPSWIWWLLAILPLESKAQLAILGMTNLPKRLSCMEKVLKIVKSRMSSIGE